LRQSLPRPALSDRASKLWKQSQSRRITAYTSTAPAAAKPPAIMVHQRRFGWAGINLPVLCESRTPVHMDQESGTLHFDNGTLNSAAFNGQRCLRFRASRHAAAIA
jgi:hypothetical protein